MAELGLERLSAVLIGSEIAYEACFEAGIRLPAEKAGQTARRGPSAIVRR
jgi:hypothetical protein